MAHKLSGVMEGQIVFTVWVPFSSLCNLSFRSRSWSGSREHLLLVQ